jgi:outer membrane lipoprotein-sorting protein
MQRLFALALIASLGALDRPVRSQTAAELPKAETVLDQYVEAIGGKAANETIKNRTASGTVEIAAANIKGTITVQAAAPNQIVAVMDLGAVGKTTEATDGKSAWMLSPLIGDRLLEGEEKDAFVFSAGFHKDVHWKEAYQKVECTGIEDVDGKPAYKVVLTPKVGKPVTQFFDKASHLKVKEVATQKTFMGEITAETYYGDYKKVDGVLMPFSITQKALGQEVGMKFTEVKHNVALPADTFKRPASLDQAEKAQAK